MLSVSLMVSLLQANWRGIRSRCRSDHEGSTGTRRASLSHDTKMLFLLVGLTSGTWVEGYPGNQQLLGHKSEHQMLLVCCLAWLPGLGERCPDQSQLQGQQIGVTALRAGKGSQLSSQCNFQRRVVPKTPDELRNIGA